MIVNTYLDFFLLLKIQKGWGGGVVTKNKNKTLDSSNVPCLTKFKTTITATKTMYLKIKEIILAATIYHKILINYIFALAL